MTVVNAVSAGNAVSIVTGRMRRCVFAALLPIMAIAGTPPEVAGQSTAPYDRADTLRGSITADRAWWDVVFYDLHVVVEPADSTIHGRVGIVYRVLEPGGTLQVDLQQPLVVDRVVRGGREVQHRRDGNVVRVPVPERTTGAIDTVVVHYRGTPRVAVNPPWDGGFAWESDSLGQTWVATANQGLGASVWWPNKDTQADEPDSQRIAITVPDPLVNVSNGRLRSVVRHDNGTATWEWFVNAPINNYGVAVNAGHYTHFGGVYQGENGPLTLDYWPLAHNLEPAREQFTQVPTMLACFEHWFGPFPWYEDGFKLVETPHLGMEHQSALAYGNGYMNGYRGRDLSGTGLGLEWDFIIIHEAAHEWWGNSITTADLADMWVHESFANYAESLHTECLRNADAGARYVRGTRAAIQNDRPIIPDYGVNAEGSGDMYYKGGNMLHTIRQIVGDDDRWRAVLRGLQSTFRHSIITGDRVRGYMSEHAGIDLDPVFRQYLTTTDVPVFEIRSRLDGGDLDGRLEYRWSKAVDGFDMPVDVRLGKGSCVRLRPTARWQTLQHELDDPDAVDVDRDYYVLVRSGHRSGAAPARLASGTCRS